MYILMGLGLSVTALAGFLIRPLRDVEELIPDAIPDATEFAE